MIDAQDARDAFLALPGAEESQPFGPDAMVYKTGGKMFAILAFDGETARINLKCDPERAVELRSEWPGSVIPGYHMNKRHWNTLVLDASLPDSLVGELIRHSHALVLASLPKKVRETME
jgi:predicted DNA-binding protein (MmcQ/YjbR family)